MEFLKNENDLNMIYKYDYLMKTYIESIIELIDTSYTLKILPLKVMFGLNYIKNYIYENKFDILQNGLEYLLTNKDTILNFDINNLNELDEDFDDNMSIKTCIKNLKTQKKTNNESDELLNIIIEIKNNAKKLSLSDINIIKKYFELLITILETMEKLFYNS